MEKPTLADIDHGVGHDEGCGLCGAVYIDRGLHVEWHQMLFLATGSEVA